MLMLSHLLIHFPLLDVLLPDLARIIVWLVNESLDYRVLHLCLSFQLLLVRGLSSQCGTGVEILDVGVVLHDDVELVLLQQVQQVLYKVHTVK